MQPSNENPAAYFSPAIIQGLGHSSIQTQLLSVPPWACAFALAMSIAILSDLVGHRFVFTLIPSAIAIVGFAILFVVHNNVHLQYAALFLAAAGTYASMPVIVCWFSTNCMSLAFFCGCCIDIWFFAVGGHSRRAVGTGWQVGFGNSRSL